jgi:hypothetical protein
VTFLQRQCDHDVRQRFGMARDDKNLIVRQRVGVVTQQFPTSDDRDLFRRVFRALGHVHAVPQSHASPDDSCWLGGALWRVDLAIDAPLSMSADAAWRRILRGTVVRAATVASVSATVSEAFSSSTA